MNRTSRLPRGDKATVRPEKIVGYALNSDHPLGKHKARLFDRLLGLTVDHADHLIVALREAATSAQAAPGEADGFGQRYTVDFPITGPNGNTATVRSAWIVRSGDPPDLVTCFIL